MYYVYAYAKLLQNEEIAAGEEINVTVPTGNFGNILAAYYAKQMGVPIAKLICASNENKVLFDFFRTGVYDRNREFILTSSPSISANGRKNKMSGLDAPYPNENNCFSYMLKERGNDKYIMLRLSEGSYDITDVACYVFPGQLLTEKQVEAAELVSEDQWETNSVLKCSVTASEDEYFVTSIPMQNGLKLYVDGKETKIETVNTAFVGAKITAGSHTVDLRFDPPGQKYGNMASLLSVVLFGIWSAITVLYRQKRKKH